MLELSLYVNKNQESKTYGQYYPRVDHKETYNLDKLAGHMAAHNTPFSKGTLKGILEDAVTCIRELTLEGNTVKVDNLAIFKCAVEGNGATLDKVALGVGNSVKNVKLLAQATGSYTRAELNKDASFGWSKETRKVVEGLLPISTITLDKAQGNQYLRNGQIVVDDTATPEP